MTNWRKRSNASSDSYGKFNILNIFGRGRASLDPYKMVVYFLEGPGFTKKEEDFELHPKSWTINPTRGVDNLSVSLGY